MRPVRRYGMAEQESSWWRKTMVEDELVEVGERPVKERETVARIKL